MIEDSAVVHLLSYTRSYQTLKECANGTGPRVDALSAAHILNRSTEVAVNKATTEPALLLGFFHKMVYRWYATLAYTSSAMLDVRLPGKLRKVRSHIG
jgi:hypothetical protein